MRLLLLISAAFILSIGSSYAQIKILFDATKAETAGNADWVIDADAFNLGYSTGPAVLNGGNEANAQRMPTPTQANITASTAETYWTGGISAWGIDCVKRGYQVETLPYNGAITYGNASNAQDLLNYQIYVVVEPNILFSASEKTAIMNFVKNGGSLFIVSDHTISDRNNDGYDSPAIWNDLINNNTVQNNPFGFTFDLANISVTSSNSSSYANDSLLHGSYGNVSQIKWSNGTTMTINPTINPSVKAAFYNTGSSNTGNTGVMVAYATFGAGKVVAFGDSSPFDDGTGDPNDNLYTGYTGDVSGNHRLLIMNATVWLATTTTLPVTLTTFTCTQQPQGVNINWTTATEINTSYFNLQKSIDGVSFSNVAKVNAKGASNYFYVDAAISFNNTYYRLEIVDNDGSKQYSKVIKLITTDNQAPIIYPNPVKDVLYFKNSNIKQANILTSSGKLIGNYSIANNQLLSVKQLPKGAYILHATNQSGKIITKTFYKL